MTPDDCALLLRGADPDRFASVAAARPADRPFLATLYAANLDIARAAIASAEPLISQMRLQFWDDQIAAMTDGRAPVTHDIATPLYQVWGPAIAPLTDLVEARRRDTQRQPFDSAEALIAYIDGCSGTVMRIAANACGYDGDPGLIRDQARGAGLAAWLAAYPRLRAMNMGFWPDDAVHLRDLAQAGLDALDSARAAWIPVPRRVVPALYAGAGARRHLQAVRDGKPAKDSEFSRNFSRMALALFGRWQG